MGKLGLYRITSPYLDVGYDGNYGYDAIVGAGSAWVWGRQDARAFARECEAAWWNNPPGFDDEAEEEEYYSSLKPYSIERVSEEDALDILADWPETLQDLGLVVSCECGEWSGEPCEWSGPAEETVIVEFMPEWLRESHIAAGGAGVYPHNGAERIRVERSCAERMLEHDPDWVEIVRVPGSV